MAARHLLQYSIVSAHAEPPTRQQVERALEAAGLGTIDLWEGSTPGDPPGMLARFLAHERNDVATARVEVSFQGERVVGEVNRAMFLVLARSLGRNDARILKTGQLSLEIEVAVKDTTHLSYLNWTIWLMDVLLNLTDGVVIDPAAQCCRGRAEWEKCAGPFDISRHVALHITEWDNETRWVHSHGMEKFAQPDLELIEVPPSLVREAILLINQIAALLAKGTHLRPGQALHLGAIGEAQFINSTSPADHQGPFGRLRMIEVAQKGSSPSNRATTLLGAGAYLEGCHLAETGQVDEALACFDRVLAADPNAEAALGAKASTLLVAQRPEEALKVAEHLQSLSQMNPDGPFIAGQALVALGRYNEAALHFTGAIQRAPDDPGLYQARARCYLALGRHQEAAADQGRAAFLALEPR
ncbi:MAG TPA: tetratricopeptide repeat protein [Ktedonobacterales bacterium]|nr:tetratricopeptide repeat protein [Ktedonobacterales bacterium]